ncbi:MAG: membrane protein insertase YidC [Treponema sp.]|nr:membrane protein insertase YidC [Treponema sp.]
MIIELAYRICYELFHCAGLSIIGVSFAVTLLCLPLYDIAEKWQKIERDTQKRLKPGIARIKACFKGDEQYMILSTFYKQNHYHPLMSLRSSISLLIQIPFFMAAYIFLSRSIDLIGYDFYFIRDFSKPDALFKVGSFSINLLPILMTIINIVAGAIYTKGFPIKEKLQIYLMALVFMIILYNSPSGMVLYWTMNNVFSLIKNFFYKLKNPLRVFRYTMFFILSGMGFFVLFKMKAYHSLPIFFTAFITFFMPKIIQFANYLLNTIFSPVKDNKSLSFSIFFISALAAALLSGLVIPSLLVKSSTAGDFAYIDSYANPLFFIKVSLFQSLGLFFFWPLIIYFLFDKKIKTFLAIFFSVFLLNSVVNAFCFQGDYGNISADLVFTEHKEIKPTFLMANLNNISNLFIITLVLIIIWKKRISILQSLSSILLISFITCGIINAVKINQDFSKVPEPSMQLSSIKKQFKLSKKNKNVIVIMLDKAPGYFFTPALTSVPSLKDFYQGFTFYPNTASLGSWTIQGAPGLYGGYDYTPWEMNHRREVSMKDKHNQSLTLLPELFAQNGFNSYLIDPPYPNYDEKPVFSFLNGKEDITALELTGNYSDLWYENNDYEKRPIKSQRIIRNLIWFGIFKISPMAFRSIVHYKDWWSNTVNIVESTSDFIDRLSVLDFLPEFTEITEDKGNFIFIDNETTHNPGYISAKNFRPIADTFSEVLTNNHPFTHDPGYHAFIAALEILGEWFHFLKEENLYDDTRIIIVSDHGSYQNWPDFKVTEGKLKLSRNREWFNPLLLVKDFNSNGKIKVDNTFMTNADVPAIALNKLIEKAINPYTGNEIKILDKTEKEKMTKISFGEANKVLANKNNGFIINDDDWYTVKDNIFDINNWSKLKVENGELIK